LITDKRSLDLSSVASVAMQKILIFLLSTYCQ